MAIQKYWHGELNIKTDIHVWTDAECSEKEAEKLVRSELKKFFASRFSCRIRSMDIRLSSRVSD
jgi:hypothetical protein